MSLMYCICYAYGIVNKYTYTNHYFRLNVAEIVTINVWYLKDPSV